jgi:hypothetical protein
MGCNGDSARARIRTMQYAHAAHQLRNDRHVIGVADAGEGGCTRCDLIDRMDATRVNRLHSCLSCFVHLPFQVPNLVPTLAREL